VPREGTWLDVTKLLLGHEGMTLGLPLSYDFESPLLKLSQHEFSILAVGEVFVTREACKRKLIVGGEILNLWLKPFGLGFTKTGPVDDGKLSLHSVNCIPEGVITRVVTDAFRNTG
jgi:hypothetical protein